MKPVVDQSVDMRAGGDKDRPAVTTVAAARSAARHPLLAPERKAAASPAASFDVNVYFVDKHKIGKLVNGRRGARLHPQPDSPTHQLLVWHDAVWHDADDPAVRAVIFEPDAARRLREDGVVFA